MGLSTLRADLPRPRALAIDLALQAAGLVAVPIAGPPLAAGPAGRGCQAWVEVAGDAAAAVDLPRVILPADLGSPPPSSEKNLGEAGGAVAIDDAGAIRELTAADLAGAYEDLAGRLGPSPSPSDREIVVSCRPLERLHERRLLAWATVAGAALLLEPDPDSLAATAAWARPTLLSADAGEAQALRRAAEAERPSLAFRLRLPWLRSSPAPPFGRLRTLLVPPGALGAGEASFWEGRGVRLVDPGMV